MFNNLDSGYVYAAKNEIYPGTLKIGLTKSNPEERIRQLSKSTGVLKPFELVHYRVFNNCNVTEKLIHKELEAFRVENNKEFFTISESEVIRIIDRYHIGDLESRIHNLEDLLTYESKLPFELKKKWLNIFTKLNWELLDLSFPDKINKPNFVVKGFEMEQSPDGQYKIERNLLIFIVPEINLDSNDLQKSSRVAQIEEEYLSLPRHRNNVIILGADLLQTEYLGWNSFGYHGESFNWQQTRISKIKNEDNASYGIIDNEGYWRCLITGRATNRDETLFDDSLFRFLNS